MSVRFRIVGTDLPGRTCGPSPDRPDGYRGIEVGVQRGKEVVGAVPADASSASWEFEASIRNGKLSSPYLHGRAGERFVYLSWGERVGEEHRMFRRAKLHVGHLDVAAIDGHEVEGRLGLTDGKGNGLCASVRPPRITWTVR
jgi:hypothetical protein